MTPEQARAAAAAIGLELPEERLVAAAGIVSGLLGWARDAAGTDSAPEPAVRFGEAR
jgi:hypothetical protein